MSAGTRTNFLGIPVEGDINRGSKRTEQKPLSELEPMLRAVINDERIASFGWTQYTPYFNDGEPCVFSLGEPWFRTSRDAGQEATFDEGDYDEEDDDTYSLWGHPTLSTERWDSAAHRHVPVERDAETLAVFARCKALADALGSGAFNDVLLEAFGDHCRVKITRDGITVDEYSHD